MIADARLIVLRHGKAGSPLEDAAQDFARPLTKKGRRQAVNAGKLLRKIGPTVAACFTSPAARCAETAALACASLKGVKPEARKALMQMTPQDGVALVAEGKTVLVVGHGPEIDALIHHVTGRSIASKKGSVAGIHIVNGQGTLEQLLTPKQIASMVKPAPAPTARAAAALSAVTLACESPRRARRTRGASRRRIRWGVTR